VAETLGEFVPIGDQGEEIRIGIHMRQDFGDSFSASLGNEPVMDYGNSHLMGNP
jgi:hypothetical protein